jgi:hypothetical protein
VLGCAASVLADEYRTWSDATGRFSLRAKVLSRDGNRVTLERDNGAKVMIEVAKLSKADQDYLSQMDSANPFETVEESPFQSVPSTPSVSIPAPVAPAPAASEPRTVKVDWSQSTPVLLNASQEEWNLAPPSPAANFKAKTVPLPAKTDFWEKFSGAAINALARKGVVGYTLGDKEKATTRIIVCDLEKGRPLATGSGPGQMSPLALHDNGQYVLMRRNEFGFGNLDRLEVWSIRGKDISRHLIWTPYDDVRGGDRDVMWAEFINANTLATSSRGGRVALWEVGTGRPICHFETTGGAVPCLSEDRKWIAFAAQEKVGMFDVEKQEVAVVAQTPGKLTWPYVALSPMGQKLGCIANDRILVWDVATGKLERDFTTPGLHIHGGIDFPHENFILANNQYLIALDNQIKLWHYQGAEFVRTTGGNAFMSVSAHNKPGVLAAGQMPHKEALAMLEKALKQPDLFVLKEGTSVRIFVDGIPADHRTRVGDALAKKLTEMNCKVAANGTIDLVAKIEGPRQREVSYFHSGDYQVQEYTTKLSFIYQGKPAWETAGTNIPGMIMLRDGENIEGVLRKASAQPAYAFYDNVVLPRFLQKPSENQGPGSGQTLGVSRVTPEGLQ